MKEFSLEKLIEEKDKGTVLSKYLVEEYDLNIFPNKEGKYSKADWLIVDNKFLELLHASNGMYVMNDRTGVAKIYQNGRKVRCACGGIDLYTALKLNKLTEEFPEDFLKEFRDKYNI